MKLATRRPGGGTPLPQRWGIDSEYGTLRDVLVGPAEHYRWQTGNAMARRSLRLGRTFDAALARRQYEEMLSAYREAGVTVHRLEADPSLPYQLYARDSSVMTPWGAVITQMYSPWRRGEWRAVLEFYQGADIPVYDVITAGALEGGDFMVLKPGLIVCGLTGERTSPEGLAQLRSWVEAEGWDFVAYEFDPYFLHLDVKLAMLAENLACACIDALEPGFVAFLRGRGIELIDISYPAMLELGCNVVALGNERVLMPAGNGELRDKCRAAGLTVIDPDIGLFAAGGGGVHCMCQPLRRDPAEGLPAS
jgi:N-dimethylarginine dimethylaminohydrolase